MAVSQFTIYSSNDVGGPGPIFGSTGSFLNVLNACLVNGYTGKPAAGWLKPLPDLSSSLGCFQQPSGSKLSIFINDAGSNVSASGKEVSVVGWEVITSLTSSNTDIYTGSVGGGFRQFPQPRQALTVGHVIWRKSFSSDTTGSRRQQWIVAADAYTFYVWIATGDAVPATFFHGGFGDIYSFYNSDNYKCLIYGRVTENLGTIGLNLDNTDQIMWPFAGTPSYPQVLLGHFMARSFGGHSGSIGVSKIGDLTLSTFSAQSNPQTAIINGVLQSPNGPDNSFYISPIYISEPIVVNTSAVLRGQLRGIYQICHDASVFSCGEIIYGSNEYAGRTFMVITPSPLGSVWAVEISNTIETN